MNEQVKWIYRIVMLFLIIMIIDINVNWRQFDPSAKARLKLVDITLIGTLTFLLVAGWVIMVKNKVKKGR
jgi:hypothetical protein